MMKTLNKTAIEQAQNDYFNLLLDYGPVISDSNLTIHQVAAFLDELIVFWLKRLETVHCEINNLTRQSQCFLLSGAIYLNIADNEHFYFKTLGDYHVLFDPLLKMEGFFRLSDRIDAQETIRYFREAYEDTTQLLKDFRNEFLILPINEIAWKNKDEHLDLLNAFFWKFISSVFPDQISSNEDFCLKYKSFTEIEGDLNVFVKENLIFTDETDSQLSLEDRIKRCCEDQVNLSVLTRNMSEPEKFLLITYSKISQVIDILLTCSSMGFIPYIRASVTFRYLALIMYTFIDDYELRSMLEKTVVFYILHNTIDLDNLNDVDFHDYCLKVKEANLLDKILKRIREINLDIFKGGLNVLSKIIQEEFSAINISSND